MPMTPTTTWRLASAFGATAVGMGAFGAHGLQKRYPDLPARSLKNWETASTYLLVHAAVLLGVSLHPRFARHRFAAPLLATGAALFSGSIYGLILGSDGLKKVLGPVTPIGGTLMIAGWVSMIL